MSPVALNRIAAVLFATALATLAAGACVWIARQPRFDLKRIEVRGELRHVTAASVRAALAGRLTGKQRNYFTLSLEDARRLFETVPWVTHASVRRVWPNRLRVTLTEYRALGVWGDGRLLSDRGELFVANADEAEIYGVLPEFSGPAEAAKDAAQRYYELSAKLAAMGLRIDAINISDRNAWALRVSPVASADAAGHGGEIRIELGRDAATAAGRTALSQRVEQLVAAYPQIVAQAGGPPARIDARYVNGLSVSMPAKPAAKSNRSEPEQSSKR
jgi:cell division protein FtsQ